jgi:hypothetical protein
MADYYPLIARAVGGLEKSTGENRRVLYERARGALVNQLRGVDPPLAESDITRERLALEEAIRKVEAEASKRTRGEPAETAAPPPRDDFGGLPHEQRGPTLTDQGLRGFREVVAEAEGLGSASAEAGRSAREFYKSVPGDRAAQTPPEHYPPPQDQPNHAPSAYDEASHYAADAYAGEPEPHADEAYTYRHADEYEHAGEPPQHEAAYHAAKHEAQEAHEPYVRPVRAYGRWIRFALLLLIAGAIVGGAYSQRQAVIGMLAGLRSHPAQQQQPREVEPAGKPKIADRIGGDNAPASANAPAAAVAQKVVLYDEDPSDPAGKRYVGSAIWRTETVSPGSGLAPELAVRADVEIPERHLRMTWSLRRNTDKALPASHTIEIMFTLPADFDQGGIGNIPGVLMKTSEQARGLPLAGLAVKVTNGYFLIGLSAVDADRQRNIQMLKERDWFDIPLVYTSGKRAILAVEKGTPGARAFEEAFRAWGE